MTVGTPEPGRPSTAPAGGAKETVAFVLGGGGTKGAFEAGAIAYLVMERGLQPEVITATSAGSICAAVLAQARTHPELVRRTHELHQDLLAMTETAQLFAKQPWLAAVDGTMVGELATAYLTEQTRPPLPGEPGDLGPIVGGLPTNPQQRRRFARLKGVAQLLPRALTIRREMRRHPESLLRLDPLAKALRHGDAGGIQAVDPGLIARPGLQLRMAVTALRAGVLRYVTQDGTIVGDDALTPVPGAGAGPVDVIEGVLASASVPLIFAPRPLADDDYVDGGVVNNIPVEAAVALGANRVYAILAIPLDQPPDERDFTKVSAPGVFLRAVGAIAFGDRQLNNLHPTLPPGVEVTVIDPVVDVVGPFEVAQGLMLLDMDYGWMRAADVLADVDEVTRRTGAAATDRVVTARTRAWYLEEALWSRGAATTVELEALAGLKEKVRRAVEERKALGLPTPERAGGWWSGYEVHGERRPSGLPDSPVRWG